LIINSYIWRKWSYCYWRHWWWWWEIRRIEIGPRWWWLTVSSRLPVRTEFEQIVKKALQPAGTINIIAIRAYCAFEVKLEAVKPDNEQQKQKQKQM
jgi:hypothetical protein